MIDDAELLRRYADERSEAAFTALVQRHIDLVYSAALRRLGGDAHGATDVAQEVFGALAHRASSLSRHTVLPAWLYTTTRNVAIDRVRANRRRKHREQEAQIMHELTVPAPGSPDWPGLRPLLDAAMDELGETDRTAVLLRFFGKHSFAEIGTILRLSEDAARMRVDRALDKLRALLAHRGVTSTAAALTGALANQAVIAAPAGLAGTIASAALSGAALTGGATAATTIGLFSMSKTAVLLIALALAVSGTALFKFKQSRNAGVEVAAVSDERETLRARLRVAEQRAAEADQDLASLQRAIESAHTASAAAEARAAALAAKDTANNALFAYLGGPVPPPANLDARYSPESLAAVFTQLCKTADLDVQKLFVDDSEYPFLVYGTIAGGHDLGGIQQALGTTPGYHYSGSSSARMSETGRPTSTYFALNMIPDARGMDEKADRRMMVRLQMLKDKVMKSK